MKRTFDEPFARHTTLGLGGPAREWLRLDSEREIFEAVRAADNEGVPFVVVGGGSNIIAADTPFEGGVLHIANRGVRFSDRRVEVAAGESWDTFVESCVAEGLQGVECLSGIPGTVGATPIQNVGAYGQEVSDTIVSVRAFDREAKRLVELTPAVCAFGYRDSALKRSTRWIVTAVTFDLQRRASLVRYGDLGRALGRTHDVPLAEVRAKVIELRRAKGMVIDPTDPESRSVGSFFTNPIVNAAQLVDLRTRLGIDVPSFPFADAFKVPAAWLIEQSGFTKGYGGPRVGISRKHSLALVHYGDGTTSELIELARAVRDGVRKATGITLVNEPVLIGVTL